MIRGFKTWKRGREYVSDLAWEEGRSESAAVFLILIKVFGWLRGKRAEALSEEDWSESLTMEPSFLLGIFDCLSFYCSSPISFITARNSGSVRSLGRRATTFSELMMVTGIPSAIEVNPNSAF